MKRKMSKQIDAIYQLVKRLKVVDVVAFCEHLDLSPSTFYNYKKFVLSRYVNIVYEDGQYKWIEHEEVPQKSEILA